MFIMALLTCALTAATADNVSTKAAPQSESPPSVDHTLTVRARYTELDTFQYEAMYLHPLTRSFRVGGGLAVMQTSFPYTGPVASVLSEAAYELNDWLALGLMAGARLGWARELIAMAPDSGNPEPKEISRFLLAPQVHLNLPIGTPHAAVALTVGYNLALLARTGTGADRAALDALITGSSVGFSARF